MSTNQLEIFRHQKDEFFGQDQHSPLLPEQRADFKGLAYYDSNSNLVLNIEVKPFDMQETITMQTSTGDIAQYLRYGRFSFKVDGQQAELTLFASPNGAGGFFLPFTDSTSGNETYGAGRYLDIERLPDGRFEIDFNLAYNPYCAYNEMWSCPIPPTENRLAVPIRAGEKNFKID